jgi:hypothetical protein
MEYIVSLLLSYGIKKCTLHFVNSLTKTREDKVTIPHLWWGIVTRSAVSLRSGARGAYRGHAARAARAVAAAAARGGANDGVVVNVDDRAHAIAVARGVQVCVARAAAAAAAAAATTTAAAATARVSCSRRRIRSRTCACRRRRYATQANG